MFVVDVSKSSRAGDLLSPLPLSPIPGDCARMITDHGHLTMKALGNKHRGDHVQLTFLQNNFKYLIREVLQGIAYLHSLHIVHRDIKGESAVGVTWPLSLKLQVCKSVLTFMPLFFLPSACSQQHLGQNVLWL